MLVILFFGFSLLAWLGWYLHRRHHRRRDAEGAGSQPDLGTWGPGRSVHDFGVMDVSPRPPISEKGVGSRALNVRVHQQPVTPNKGSRRLKKSWLRRSGA